MEISTLENRHQMFMTSLDMMVSQDSIVRVIDAFLDFSDSLDKVRSSRQLEKACNTNVELFWLNKNLKPCYKTIANFRKDNNKGFRTLFVQFRNFCIQLELYGKSLVAVDGSKFRGQNSMKNNYNIRKVNKHLDYIENQQSEYLKNLDLNDNDDQKLLNLQKRKDKYLKLKEQLSNTDETQISTVDPDTRALPLHMRIVQVGFNLQSVVDHKYKLIVDYQVTNKTDHRALAPMALLGHNNNIHTIVAIPRKPKKTDNSKPPHLRKENFLYNPEDDTYTCSNLQTLTNQATYQRKDKKGNPSGKFDRYSIKYSICKNCKYLKQCVSKSNQQRHHGRYLDRYHTDGAVARNKQHLNANKKLYKQRQAIVEHPFGTIKRQWGFNHTLMKTIPNVSTEFSIILLCYNLRRALSILGPNALKLALNELFSSFRSLSAFIIHLIHFYKIPIPQLSTSFSV